MYRHADAVEMNAFAAYALAGLATPDDAPSAARCALALRERGQTPTVLPASPLVHGTALNLSAAAWLLGGSVVFLESRSFDAHELWRAVERERVTQIGIVGDAFAGPMLRALEEAEAEGRTYDVSSVERVLSSGAPWSLRLKQGLAERGSMTLVETIGASEGGPTAVAVVPPGTRAQDARFVLGERARLLAEDGTELAPGSTEAGLLAMMPPIPFAYFKDPDRSAQVFRQIGGQRYSICGDYARLNADGSVDFLGRGSLCINTAGEKVYPEEVEAAFRAHPSVGDANVVGLADEIWQSGSDGDRRLATRPERNRRRTEGDRPQPTGRLQSAQTSRLRAGDPPQSGRQGAVRLGPARGDRSPRRNGCRVSSTRGRRACARR